VLQIFPTHIPTLLIVVLHVVPPAIFALIHGRRLYGTRGILVFIALCLGIGSFFELLSLRTGFPFGHYVFTSVMGPKVFGLPILLALAYVGIGYVAWVLASLIVQAPSRSLAGAVIRPLVAACTMTAWDFAMDPVWAYVDRAWIWRDGGRWFGVPVSNYFGWMLTTWVFYQAFALWIRRRETPAAPPSWQHLAVLVYGIAAAGNLLLAIPSSLPPIVPATIADAAGRHWETAAVVHACMAVSLLVMIPFALLAWIRVNVPPRMRASSQPRTVSQGLTL